MEAPPTKTDGCHYGPKDSWKDAAEGNSHGICLSHTGGEFHRARLVANNHELVDKVEFDTKLQYSAVHTDTGNICKHV